MGAKSPANSLLSFTHEIIVSKIQQILQILFISKCPQIPKISGLHFLMGNRFQKPTNYFISKCSQIPKKSGLHFLMGNGFQKQQILQILFISKCSQIPIKSAVS